MFQGLINVDYESEVEDDILPIFRKGEVWSTPFIFWVLLSQIFILAIHRLRAIRLLLSSVEYVNRPSYFPWQEYNYGEEFVLLVTFAKNASDKNTKDAMNSFAQLTSSLPSLIVQSTQGAYEAFVTNIFQAFIIFPTYI